MAVIAMTREMGTMGKDVAIGVAKRLGLEVIHHELVEGDVAKRMDIEPSKVHHFLEGQPSLMERWKIDKKKLSRYTAEEILELAERGRVVIRGWGAANLLRSIPHVLCVRVCAPMSFRVKNLKQRLGIYNEQTAWKEIEQNDAAHTRTIRYFFDADWKDPVNYDIVLNTKRLPVEQCIDQICRLTKCPEFAESNASQTMLSDKLIEFRVQDVLSQLNSGRLYVRPTKVVSGKVYLSGTTTGIHSEEHIKKIVSGVSGVKAVEAELATINVQSTRY